MDTTPVLLLIFNRPDTTKQVFEAIKKQKPKYLFVAADGPRLHKEGETDKCQQAREIVLNNIDWDCEVKTLIRDNNLGCGIAVYTAVDWFFEHVELGIILEDDCLPSASFFGFCDVLLKEYEFNEQVFCINGTSFVDSKNGASYYFSKHFDPWGWATWKRAWKHYDYQLKNWNEFKLKKRIKNIDSSVMFKKYWAPILDDLSKMEYKNTWDHQWMFACWYNQGLVIKPNVNLISNLGFHPENATHTIQLGSSFGNRQTYNIGKIIRPNTGLHIRQNLEKEFLEKRYFIRSRYKSYYIRLKAYFQKFSN